jgi:hypothetical protein
MNKYHISGPHWVSRCVLLICINILILNQQTVVKIYKPKYLECDVASSESNINA